MASFPSDELGLHLNNPSSWVLGFPTSNERSFYPDNAEELGAAEELQEDLIAFGQLDSSTRHNALDDLVAAVDFDTRQRSGVGRLGPEERGTQSHRVRRRRPKARGPPLQQWKEQKQRIWDIYVKNDETLQKTMDLMKDDYQFEAT